jgi:hypothetical protein
MFLTRVWVAAAIKSNHRRRAERIQFRRADDIAAQRIHRDEQSNNAAEGNE